MAIARAGFGVLVLAASAMAATPPGASTATPPAASVTGQAPPAAPAPEGDWTVLRVGGDMAAQVRWDDEQRSQSIRVGRTLECGQGLKLPIFTKIVDVEALGWPIGSRVI
ncbi:hypothetical protein J4558_21595 [Leptolyngbya sp. 15MV]|nr:hypothetical protein J4558_21595 [Leptolyngbya sp. 15MV]